jgi:hypothetical protein
VVRDLLSRIGVSESEIAAMGPEGRANESIGPIAVAVALDTLARAKARGAELSDRQRRKLARALSELIAAEPPESPFQGWDADLIAELSPALTADRDVFAGAVWGKRWHDVFTAGSEKACNIFDPDTAAPYQRAQYRRMADALWGKARPILENTEWARKNPWDRSEIRASLAREPGLGESPLVADSHPALLSEASERSEREQ